MDHFAAPRFDRGVQDPVGGWLLPAIAVDVDGGAVLMMAWMNEASWLATQSEGRAVYFSRSRGELWRKGDTSGHRQEVVELRTDCDGDTILVVVRQTGAACHEGYRSCFFRVLSDDGWVVDEKMEKPGV